MLEPLLLFLWGFVLPALLIFKGVED